MTKEQLLILINQKITSNGSRAIKGEDLNLILTELLLHVPTDTFNPSDYYTRPEIDAMLEEISGSIGFVDRPGYDLKLID